MLLRHDLALDVADETDAHAGHQNDAERQRGDLAVNGISVLALVAQVPRADRQQNSSCRKECREDRVREGDQLSGIGQHLPDRRQLDAVLSPVVDQAHRMLHEAVRSEDEVRADHRPQRCQPNTQQMYARAQ